LYKLLKGLSAEKPHGGRKPGVLQLARTVFWSFFGVRKRKDLDVDAGSLTPLQVIVAGLIGAVILVLSLAFFVRQLTA
jgi:hypothetical protein